MPADAKTLLTRALTTQKTHTPMPLFPALQSENKIPKTMIVSCVDMRVPLEQIFGLTPEDAVIVFRTVAGHPQPIFNGLLALDLALGGMNDILVLHHTDCGSTYWTEEGVKEGLKGRCAGHEENIEWRVFGACENGIEKNLKEDVAWLKGQPLMRAELVERVRGFMFDIETGELREVDSDA